MDVKSFLEDFAALCAGLEDATPDAEYYDVVKTSIRDFRRGHKGLWAEAFIALLRADVESDIAAASDPRGVTGAVWSTREKVETMLDRCDWGRSNAK